jgi:hypothetical protein
LSGEFELLVAEVGDTGRVPGITESLVVLVCGARERAAGFRMAGILRKRGSPARIPNSAVS